MCLVYSQIHLLYLFRQTQYHGVQVALADNVNQTGSIFSMENSLKNGLSGAQVNGLNFVNNVFGGSILTLTSGNVGINNTNPASAATLDVTGTIYCTSISTVSLYTSAINTPIINGIYYKRWKCHIYKHKQT
jgi:hypothetical protein